MKFILVLFALLMVGIAKPQDDQIAGGDIESKATGKIERVINAIKQRLVVAGLDPLEVKDSQYEKVTRLGSSRIWAKELLYHGFSNIVIESLIYDLANSELKLALIIPRISLNQESVGLEVDVLGHKFSSNVGGSLDVVGMRVVASIRLDVGTKGISVRSSNVEFSLSGVKSNLKVIVQGRDLSTVVNKMLGETIPSKIRAKKSLINGVLSAATHRMLNHLL